MTWMHKPKHRTLKPERCQRCHAQVPTEEIRMLWQAREAATDGAQDWWFCAECAAELRRGAPPSTS